MKKTASVTICVPMVNNALFGARAAGLDINRLLTKSGIAPELMHRSDGYIPLEQFVLLYR